MTIYEAHMHAWDTASKSGYNPFGLIWNSIWLESLNSKLKLIKREWADKNYPK